MPKSPRKSIPNRLKARLQKEIQSRCPFCLNEEVEYFEIHHIDEDRSNNDDKNLIMLCAICHSKITKGDISLDEVRKVKYGLPNLNSVEFVSIVIDSDKCDWRESPENEYAFFRGSSSLKSPFPLFNLSFVNNGPRTVLLKTICLHVKYLPSGIHGLPKARVLKPLAKYEIQIESERNKLNLTNPIEVPSKTAFLFQIEVSAKIMDRPDRYEIKGRKVFDFEFKFSGGPPICLPPVYINCLSEKEPLQIEIMS